MKTLVTFLFVFTVLMFALQGHYQGIRTVEENLTKEARDKLDHERAGDARLGEVDIKFDRLDGMLTGYVRSEEAKEAALKAVKTDLTAGRIKDGIIIESAPPLRFNAEFDGKMLKLSGLIAGGATKTKLREGLKTSGFSRVDTMDLGGDGKLKSPWAAKMPAFLKDYFRDVPTGKVSFLRKDLTLEREVRDEAMRERITSAAEEVWDGSGNLHDKMTLGPMLEATFDDKALTLKGRVPTEEMKESIAASGKAAGAKSIVNELEVVDGLRSPDWGAGMGPFLGGLVAQSDSGKVNFGVGRYDIIADVAQNAVTLPKEGDAMEEGDVEGKSDDAGKGDDAGEGEGAAKLASEKLSLSEAENLSLLQSNLKTLREEAALLVPSWGDPNIAIQVPARFDAELSDGRLKLSGLVASGSSKEALLVGLKENGFANIDASNLQTHPQVGAQDWEAGVAVFLKDFLSQPSAKLKVAGNQVQLDREVADEGARDALVAQAEALFSDKVKIDEGAIPFGPALNAVLKDGTLELNGRVPTEDMRVAIAKDVAAGAGIASIRNGLEVVPDVREPKWGEGAGGFLGTMLNGAKSGRVNFAPGNFNIDGNLSPDADPVALKKEADGLVPAWESLKIGPGIPLPEPSITSELVDGTLKLSGTISPGAAKDDLLAGLKGQGFDKVDLSGLTIDPDAEVPAWMAKYPAFLKGYLDGMPSGDTGSLSIGPEGVKMGREVGSEATKARLASMAKSIWPDKVVNADAAKLGPLVEARLVDGELSLNGRVPTAEMKEVFGQAGADAGITKVTNDLKVDAEVRKPSWGDGLPSLLGKLFKGAKSGEVKFGSDGYQLDGELAEDANLDALQKEAASLVPDWGELAISKQLEDAILAQKPGDPGARLKIENGEWVLEGAVPDEKEKAELGASLRYALPGVSVDNQLRTGSMPGAFGWLGNLPKFLGKFSTATTNPVMELDAVGKKVAFKGTIESEAVKAELLEAAKNAFGADFEVSDSFQIMEPTSKDFAFENKDGVVKISGAVPDDATRKALTAGMKKAYPDAKIDNSGMKIEEGAVVPSWVQRISGFFEEFRGKSSAGKGGQIDFEGDEAKLSGVAKSEMHKEAITARLERYLGSGYKVVNDMEVSSDPKDQEELPGASIFFGNGKTDVSEDQLPAMKKAAELIQDAGSSVSVLLKGFASKSGTKALNQRLSDKRAAAVRKGLIEAGIRSETLKTLGMGASSSGEGSEAKNRRVDFIIIK